MHYCGGQLENISYVTKSNNCCGEDEDSQNTEDDGCCKDEQYVLKSNIDFTLNSCRSFDLTKKVCDLFYGKYPLSRISNNHHQPIKTIVFSQFPPPKNQQHLLVSTSVLRI
jgi:hypothetical protein